MESRTGKRRDIVLAACREFERNGFEGTGMERIAEAAKVSKRTLYKHFPNKEAVFTAITSHLQRNVRLRECPEYSPEASLEEQLELVLLAMLRTISSDEHIRLSRIVIGEVVRDPALARSLARSVDITDKAPYLWVEAAMRDGRLRPGSPDKAMDRLAGLAKSVALWPCLTFGSPPLDGEQLQEAARECAAFFLAYYRA